MFRLKKKHRCQATLFMHTPTINVCHYFNSTGYRSSAFVLLVAMSTATAASAIFQVAAITIQVTPELASTNYYEWQWLFFGRNIGQLTPKIIYFHYLRKFFLDQSIQQIFYLILKTEALMSGHVK